MNARSGILMAVLVMAAFCSWVMIPRAPQVRIRVAREVTDIDPIGNRFYAPQSYDPYFVHQNFFPNISVASSRVPDRPK